MFAAGLGLFTLASSACALVPGIGWVFEALPVAQQRIYQPQAKPFEMFDGWPETFGRIQGTRLMARTNIRTSCKP